jgi:hypothetical protein
LPVSEDVGAAAAWNYHRGAAIVEWIVQYKYIQILDGQVRRYRHINIETDGQIER